MIEVCDGNRAGCGVEGEREFPAFEYASVVIAERGHEHLAAHLVAQRLPVNVEKLAVRRSFAPLENVLPPGILEADSHVVRHEVEQMADTAGLTRIDERRVLFRRADFGLSLLGSTTS